MANILATMSCHKGLNYSGGIKYANQDRSVHGAINVAA